MERKAKIARQTKETDISVSLNLDGSGQARLDLPLGFLAHLLTAFSRHSLIDLTIKAKGDLEVDDHHLTEDLGLVLGTALKEALGSKKGIKRFGFASVPMDEALVEVSLDISGRPYFFVRFPRLLKKPDHFAVADAKNFLKPLVQKGEFTLHLECRRGEDIHHILEAAFKALGLAFRQAAALDPKRTDEVPSSKGVL